MPIPKKKKKTTHKPHSNSPVSHDVFDEILEYADWVNTARKQVTPNAPQATVPNANQMAQQFPDFVNEFLKVLMGFVTELGKNMMKNSNMAHQLQSHTKTLSTHIGAQLNNNSVGKSSIAEPLKNLQNGLMGALGNLMNDFNTSMTNVKPNTVTPQHQQNVSQVQNKNVPLQTNPNLHSGHNKRHTRGR